MDQNDAAVSVQPDRVQDGPVIPVVTESVSTAGGTKQSIEVFKLLVDVLRIAAWPVLVTALIISYRGPIRSVLESLAMKLSEASKVTIGGLSVEIQEKARQVGSAELARQVGTLSPLAIQELLRTPREGTMGFLGGASTGDRKGYSVPSEANLAAFLELEGKGMLKFRDEGLEQFLAFVRSLRMKETDRQPGHTTYLADRALTDSESKRLNLQRYEFTEAGRKVAEAIVQAVGEQLR